MHTYYCFTHTRAIAGVRVLFIEPTPHLATNLEDFFRPLYNKSSFDSQSVSGAFGMAFLLLLLNRKCGIHEKNSKKKTWKLFRPVVFLSLGVEAEKNDIASSCFCGRRSEEAGWPIWSVAVRHQWRMYAEIMRRGARRFGAKR